MWRAFSKFTNAALLLGTLAAAVDLETIDISAAVANFTPNDTGKFFYIDYRTGDYGQHFVDVLAGSD